MTLADSEIPLFKEWILTRVKQIVESDHDILADYIIALLQHDGSIDHLRQICLKDLKDFLHAQTEPFVEQLLEAYQSKSYLAPEPVQQTPAAPFSMQNNNSGNDMNNMNNNGNNGNDMGNNNNNFISANNGIPGFGGSPDGSVPFNTTGGFFSNNNNNNNQNSGFGNDMYNNNNNNNQRNNRNGFRNRGNNNGYHQNRNGNRNFNNNYNNNFQNQDSNAIDTSFDNNGNSNFNNNNYSNYNNNNGYQRRNKAQYLNSIASTQADDEFVKRRLVIEKIPDDKFNEEAVRTYFQRFGEITHLELDQDNQLAFLEFKTHHEAREAWQSPDPIFGNRFVKVYWRKNDPNEANADNTEQEKIDVEAVKIVQAQKQREFEEKLAKKKANQEKMLEITKQKLKLLELQKEHAEKLLQIAQKSGDPSEISTKQNTTDALHAQLEALKQEAARLGIPTQPMFPVVNHARGGHSYRGGSTRGRGNYYNSYYSPYARTPRGGSAVAGAGFNTGRFNLDLRPRTINIKPVSADKEEALREYLVSSVGEYEDFNRVDDSSINVTFKDRRAAESFYYAPTNPDIGELEKQWKATEKPANDMEVDN